MALPKPGRLLTIDDFALLPEDDQHRWELVEGNLVMSPSPTPRHNVAVGRLFALFENALPADLAVVPDVDLDLGLAERHQPGTARRPDLVVVTRDELRRVDAEGGILRGGAATLVVEIVSPGSRRTDEVFKRNDYADAGIPHYWIVDLGEPASVITCHLAPGFGYQDPGAATGLFEVTEPFPVRFELAALG